jgi:hypothetical protein
MSQIAFASCEDENEEAGTENEVKDSSAQDLSHKMADGLDPSFTVVGSLDWIVRPHAP